MLRALFALLLLSTAPAWAAPADPCASPRSAAENLGAWQREGSWDPARAAACLDVPAGANASGVAVQLKQVLDARGLYVPASQLSADPEFAEDGVHAVRPLPHDLPELELVRGDDRRWRYSAETVAAVPDLYRHTFSPVSQWFQSQLPAAMYARFLGLFLWQYLYGGALLLVAFAAGQIVRLLLRGQVRRWVSRLGLDLHDEDYRRTNFPIVVMVVLGVVQWGVADLQLPVGPSAALHAFARAGLWLAGLVALSRFLNVGAGVARDWAKATESKLDDQLIPMVRQASQIALIVVGGLYFADAIGFDVWKLAAGVGIGGLAFALAAQDTVANLFGSVNIFVDRPFQIGDWVVIGPVEGVVEEVGFRSTRVRTFYNSVVTIPNSQITNANVDNMGKRDRRRVKMTLGLTYDTPPDKLQAYVEGVRAILATHPLVQRSYEVHLYNLGGYAIEILVYYHVVVPDWHAELVTRSQNILEFVRLADTLGVSFAFPSQSVYLESTPEKPLEPQRVPPIDALQAMIDAFAPGGDQARPGGTPFQHSWSVQARAERDARGSVHDGDR